MTSVFNNEKCVRKPLGKKSSLDDAGQNDPWPTAMWKGPVPWTLLPTWWSVASHDTRSLHS